MGAQAARSIAVTFCFVEILEGYSDPGWPLGKNGTMIRRIAFEFCVAAVIACTGMVPALAADAKLDGKSANGAIELVEVWARNDGQGGTAVYLHILNNEDTDDRLIAVTSSQAKKCVIQKTTWEGMNVKIVTVDEIPTPAVSRTRLKPGGTYIKVFGLKDAKTATHIPMTFTFAKAGMVGVSAPFSARMLGSWR